MGGGSQCYFLIKLSFFSPSSSCSLCRSCAAVWGQSRTDAVISLHWWDKGHCSAHWQEPGEDGTSLWHCSDTTNHFDRLKRESFFFSLGNNINVFLGEVNKTMFASRGMKTSIPGAGHIFPVTTSSRSPGRAGFCCHLSPKAEHPPHFLSLLHTENCCVGWINM